MRTSLLAALYLLLPHVLSSLPPPYEQISLAGTELLEQEVVKTSTIPPNLKKFLDCSIDNYRSTGFPFLKWAEPLSTEAFVQRRNKVAQALYSQGLDAFVAETEYPMRYYANFTWSLSERPMLMVVQPVMNTTDNTVYANTTFLVAAFEAGRLNLLDTAMGSPLSTIVWHEHWDPYATLTHSPIFASTESPKIMVEAEMRDFVSRSLGAAGFNVIGYGGEVEAVRQIKTKQEVEIMRAVNTGTVSAIREMRKCLVPGLKGHEIQTVLQKTLLQAFTKSAFAIVAIGPQASSPHGGFGGEAELTEDDFILIDVGAVLYDFESDITRTFFPPFTKKLEKDKLTDKLKEQLFVWDTVHKAQTAAIDAMIANASCASVDLAARHIIEKAGYGEYFTHRLGHSIGLQGHESPYLNQGNTNTKLKPGMLFTSEPGVYIWDKLGVRHEDVILVTEGEAECLSCGFEGRRPSDPWEI